MSLYYVYIITNRRNGTLYIGSTNDLGRRIWEHKNKQLGAFSKKYNLTKLVYYETSESWDGHKTREKQMKKWKRAWKLKLIEELNPNWEDLYWGLES